MDAFDLVAGAGGGGGNIEGGGGVALIIGTGGGGGGCDGGPGVNTGDGNSEARSSFGLPLEPGTGPRGLRRGLTGLDTAVSYVGSPSSRGEAKGVFTAVL